MESQYRSLTNEEILILEKQSVSSSDFSRVKIADTDIRRIKRVHFEGDVYLGKLSSPVDVGYGMKRQAAIEDAVLINTTVGDNARIKSVGRFIMNYTIGEGTVIENISELIFSGEHSCGLGTNVRAMNENGGRQCPLFSEISAQIAYLYIMYRGREKLISKLKDLIDKSVSKEKRNRGYVGKYSQIINTAVIRDSKIGDYSVVSGASLIEKTTIHSVVDDFSFVGTNAIIKESLLLPGSHVSDGAFVERALVGGGSKLSKGFIGKDSLFFANSDFSCGEAVNLVAGPYSASHHRATLYIAALTSFSNAGSGTNMSNHMYKSGAVHQGYLARGVKTGSFSYMLFPSRVGAFSTVIGKHKERFDTYTYPFSYILEPNEETNGKSVLLPAKNIFSVSVIRDEIKFAKRERRKSLPYRDRVNINAFSPYTASLMAEGVARLTVLLEKNESSSYIIDGESMVAIPQAFFKRGINLYRKALDKYLGSIFISKVRGAKSEKEFFEKISDVGNMGKGSWRDILGLLTGGDRIERLIADIEKGDTSLDEINTRFKAMDASYYEDEWNWAAAYCYSNNKCLPADMTNRDLYEILNKYKDALDYEEKVFINDMRNDFGIQTKIGYGADVEEYLEADFEAVRGKLEDLEIVQTHKDALNSARKEVAIIFDILGV